LKELLVALAQGLVDHPDDVSVVIDEPDENGISVYHLKVNPIDMGRVIGKQGRIAKAIRTIMKSAAIRNHEKINVEIDD